MPPLFSAYIPNYLINIAKNSFKIKLFMKYFTHFTGKIGWHRFKTLFLIKNRLKSGK